MNDWRPCKTNHFYTALIIKWLHIQPEGAREYVSFVVAQSDEK